MSRFPMVLVKRLRRVGSGGVPLCLKYLQGETKVSEQTGILGIKKEWIPYLGENARTM